MIPMRRGEGRWAGASASELQHPRRCATKVQSVLPLKVPGQKKLSPQRSLLLPIPVSRPLVRCVICAVKSSISAVKEATSAVSRSLVGRQSGVAPTLVSVSEMASSTSCTMRPSSLPQCTDFQQFALPRDNKRLSLKRACSASSFATGCAGCLQTPPAEGCVRAGDGFLATDARNSPEACCVGLSCVLTRCACLTVASCPRAWARDPAHQTPAPQPPPPHPRKPHPRGSRTSHGVATHTHPTPQ
jgi:hypothetical protein